MTNNAWKSKTTKVNHNRYIIERMFGVTVAADSMTRYNARIKDDPCALNILGILLEREGLLKSAKTAFETCLKFLNSASKEQNVKVILNMGRICFKLKEFQQAITVFSSLSDDNFDGLCGLAISMFKAGLYKEAYEVYKKSLTLAPEDLRSHILVAMATIAYKFQVRL